MWPSLPATYASLWEEKRQGFMLSFLSSFFAPDSFFLPVKLPLHRHSHSHFQMSCLFATSLTNMHTKQFLHTRSVGKLSSLASVYHIWCDSCLPLPASGEAASVGRAECGKDNKERNDPWHRIEDSVSKGLRRHKQSLQKRRRSGVKY